MKTLFRNFLVTIKRFKLSTTLNVLGLSVAFGAFLVLMIQVRYEQTYDRFHSNAERTYRVELGSADGTYLALVSHPTIGLMRENIPQIEEAVYVTPDFSETYIVSEHNGEKVAFRENAMAVSPGFVNMYDYELVEGDLSTWGRPDRVLIPESMARRYFGEASALDKPVSLTEWEVEYRYSVAGVYRDFPENTWLPNLLLRPEPEQMKEWGKWTNRNSSMQVMLAEGADPRQVEAQMLEVLKASPHPMEMFPVSHIRLNPVPELYYTHDTEFDFVRKGSRSTSRILLGIAILVIVIAGINFVNFSTSLAPLRMKSINTRKVLGSPVSALRRALLAEAVGVCVIAFGLALLWAYIFGITPLQNFLVASISLSANLSMILLTLGVALLVGLVAGLYPAWYTTSFPPALVLKGSFGLSPKGRKLRTALIGFQYVISIGLIITAVFMQLQNRFVRSTDKGFDHEQIVMADLDGLVDENNKNMVINRLTESPLVEDVGFSLYSIGGDHFYSRYGDWEEGGPLEIYMVPVSWNLPEMLGIRILEGRGFRESDAEKHIYLFNRATDLRRKIEPGMALGQWNAEAAGVMADFNFKSLHHPIEPMAFQISPDYEGALKYSYIKISGDPRAAVDHIRRTIASIDPTFPLNIEFYDSVFNEVYKNDTKTAGLITIFSLLAIVISLVGVFGLVMFETQYRRKEIGVRKVFGASIREVLGLFNRSFVRIVMVCFVLAAPVAWYGIDRWLGGFAYRTPIHWWVFALSLGVVLVITLSTVTLQSWRAATANPVKALRSE